MRIFKNVLLFILTVALLVVFTQCNNSKSSKELYVGTWREVRHGNDDSYDDRDAMSMSLNTDNTFSLSLPRSRYPFSGTWAIAVMDTTTLLVLKNKFEINNRDDYDVFQKNNYNGDYRRYYIFKINKAVKGKLYLTDVTTTSAYDASKEHLLKPQE